VLSRKPIRFRVVPCEVVAIEGFAERFRGVLIIVFEADRCGREIELPQTVRGLGNAPRLLRTKPFPGITPMRKKAFALFYNVDMFSQSVGKIGQQFNRAPKGSLAGRHEHLLPNGPVRALSMVDATPTDARSAQRAVARLPVEKAYARRHGNSTPCNQSRGLGMIALRFDSTFVGRLEGQNMQRVPILFSVVVLSSAGVAVGQQGQVVSYYLAGPPGSTVVVIPEVPVNGFILTDVVGGPSSPGNLILVEETQAGSQTKLYLPHPIVGIGSGTGYDAFDTHFVSGIPFTAGSVVKATLEGSTERVTISGFVPIPAAAGNVPAVGSIGLVVLVVLLLGAGGVILARRRVNPSV